MSKKKQVIAAVVFIISFILLVCFPIKVRDISTYDVYNKEPFDPIVYNDSISQEFVSQDNYKYIGLYYANYGKILKKGYINVIIENENGKKKIRKIRVNSILDNSVLYIKCNLKKGEKYILTIQNKNKSDITFYTTETKIESTKIINYDLDDKILIMSFIKEKNKYKSLWYYLMILSIYLGISVLNVGGKYEK